MPIQHLLVATDFSDRARTALGYAIELARQLTAQIALLHVVPPVPRGEVVIDASLRREMPRVSEEVIRAAEHRLDALLAKVPHAGVSVQRLVESGEPGATIIQVATALPADLVVMATHARTGVAELVFGSVAHRVVVGAPCPVVTLRGDEAWLRALAPLSH